MEFFGDITNDNDLVTKEYADGRYERLFVDADLDNQVVDIAVADVFTTTITTDTAFSIINANDCDKVTLIINNGGSHKVTWPRRTRWSDHTPPELQVDGTDVVTFLTTDGGTRWIGIKTALRLEPEEQGYIIFSSPNSFALKQHDLTKGWDGTMEYSVDGVNWSVWDGTTVLSSGDTNRIYMRGTGNTRVTAVGVTEASWVLTGSDVSIDGNIENLLDYATVQNEEHPTMANRAFNYWMADNTALIKAPLLKAETLSAECYYHMFAGCPNLSTAPILPAINLATQCYYGMFRECTGLTAAPELSATVLAYHCYDQMFRDCTGITTPSALPATTLEMGCYKEMYENCTSLATTPELPANVLAQDCYNQMFLGCTSLTTPASLAALDLQPKCYYQMFANCSSIKASETMTEEYGKPYRIPTTGTGVGANLCNYSFFSGTGGTFTGTPDVNKTYYLWSPMLYILFSSDSPFSISTTPYWEGTVEYSTDGGGWSTWDGSSVTSGADNKIYFRGKNNTRISAHNGSVTSWKIVGNNVSCQGNIENLLDYTVVNAGNHPTMDNDCFSSMFERQTALISAPKLSAVTLSGQCYRCMFYGCTNLTSAPALPATSLESSCYYSMFTGCVSLETPPALPATTLADSCYTYMFNGCTGLTTTPALPATTLADSCYEKMFQNCTGLTIPTALPAITLVSNCYQLMFDGCTGIKISDTLTDEYTVPYRIPTSGTGVISGSQSCDNMFTGTSGTWAGSPAINTTYYLWNPKGYITFSSPNSFTLKVDNAANVWDGTMEVSTDGETWTAWTGTTVSSGTDNKLYVRGTGNTMVSGKLLSDEELVNAIWTITGSDVSVDGNIENLLDYTTTVAGNHPTAAAFAFSQMFYGQTALVQAPKMKCKLVRGIYKQMFKECTNLTSVPDLPETTLAEYCYWSMFEGCTGLTTPATLPATTIPDWAYVCMFRSCTNIKLSKTWTEEYTIPYRIPSSGTGTATSSWNSFMFDDTGGTFTDDPDVNHTYYLYSPIAALKFSSDSSFSMMTTDPYNDLETYKTPQWDGTIEYSQDGTTWNTWDGTSITSGTDNKLYFRGTGNTCITGNWNERSLLTRWRITGTNVSCNGNLENIFDYATVAAGGHPTTKYCCCFCLFTNNTALIKAPTLGATTIPNGAYYSMFENCTNLTECPELPATKVGHMGYAEMFSGCTSLTSVPELPATALDESSYNGMFIGCTGLTAPAILPATTIPGNAYYAMFKGCTGIKISETMTDEYTIPYRIPSTGTGTIESYSLTNMFTGTSGTFTGTPDVNKTYYLYKPLSYVKFTSDSTLSITAASISWDGTMEYSTDGEIWSVWSDTTITSDTNNVLYIRGIGNTLVTHKNGLNYVWSLSGSNIRCKGSVESLLDYETYTAGGHPQMGDYCFASMFSGASRLIVAPELTATALSAYCYENMFRGCIYLTEAPSLPALDLDTGCYRRMFDGCKSLTTMPELPATELASYCYESMFESCTGLTQSTALPATTLADYCYEYMFSECTGLTIPATLKATNMQKSCYDHMYYKCTNIKVSETMTNEYTIPYRLPSEGTGTEASWWNSSMFSRTGGTFTGDPDVNKTYYLYKPLSYVKFTSDSTLKITTTGAPWDGTMEYSVNGVDWFVWSGGAITSDTNNTLYIRGTGNTRASSRGGINYVWSLSGSNIRCKGSVESLLDYETYTAGGHPQMDKACFHSMFRYQDNLVEAPQLTATTLSESCYSCMFEECVDLVAAPELPATTLADYCYNAMFCECTKLTVTPELPVTSLAKCCYRYMFYGCTGLTTPSTLPATTLAEECYENMFTKCGGIKISETSTDEYTIPYRIPSLGTGVTASDWNIEMFSETGGTFTGDPAINKTYYLYKPISALKFSSSSSFTLATADNVKQWDGTMEYSQDAITWSTWDGTTTLNSNSSNILYVRGINNTVVSPNATEHDYLGWILTGSNISCDGNIETLLDYTTVAAGNHPTMGESAFACLFASQRSLIKPPELKAITLSDDCYFQLFYRTNITTAPTLPAMEMACSCYEGMFGQCTKLTSAPALPSLSLAEGCYADMFAGCASLTTLPYLPATTLAVRCYEHMFALMGTLRKIILLPATNLPNRCYTFMFSYDVSESDIVMSTTKTATAVNEYRVPASGTGTVVGSQTTQMLGRYTSGWSSWDTLEANTTYYTNLTVISN